MRIRTFSLRLTSVQCCVEFAGWWRKSMIRVPSSSTTWTSRCLSWTVAEFSKGIRPFSMPPLTLRSRMNSRRTTTPASGTDGWKSWEERAPARPTLSASGGRSSPESSAIVKGAEAALTSILPGSRRYAAIVDIGAGTTDMGWFRWIASDEEDRLYFFSAKTCLVGCDDVDDRLLDILAVPPDQRAQLFPRVREAKPELGVDRSVDVGGGYRSLCSDDLDQAVDEVAGRSFEEYGDSFGQAYKKEKNTDRWKDIRVVLVGGGSQLEGFRGQFELHPRWQQFGGDVDFLLPGSLESAGFTANTLKAWALRKYHRQMPMSYSCCLPLDCRIPQWRYQIPRSRGKSLRCHNGPGARRDSTIMRPRTTIRQRDSRAIP